MKSCSFVKYMAMAWRSATFTQPKFSATVRALILLIVMLSASLAQATTSYTWTGGAGTLWSNASNWSPAGVPINGDSVIFPLGPPNKMMTNDLSGLSLGGITFNDGGYTIGGNGISLNGPYISYGGNLFNVPINVQARALIGARGLNTLANDVFAGVIDANARLDIWNAELIGGLNTHANDVYVNRVSIAGNLSGTGNIFMEGELLLTCSGNFSGTIRPSYSMFDLGLNGTSLPLATIFNIDDISGTGTVGTLLARIISSPGSVGSMASFFPHTSLSSVANPALNTSSVALLPNGYLIVNIGGPANHSQINVKVAAFLGNETSLSVHLDAGFVPSPGQQFVILKNDGNAAITGELQLVYATGGVANKLNLSEGAIINIEGYQFRLTYRGGDGNDIVLTALNKTPVPTVSLQSTRNPSLSGEPTTFTITVSGSGAAPTGAVTLYDNGTYYFGNQQLQSGVATYNDLNLSFGSHLITASYSGDQNYAAAVGTLAGGQTVSATAYIPLSTTTTVTASPNPATPFQTVTFTVTVLSAKGLAPGEVIVNDENGFRYPIYLDTGHGSFSLFNLNAGTHKIPANYVGGDGTFAPSSGSLAGGLLVGGQRLNLFPFKVPNSAVNSVYPTQYFTANGFNPPYIYSVTSGSLPPGLNLSAGGVLSGISSQLGIFNFTLTVKDHDGFSDSLSYTISIMGVVQQTISFANPGMQYFRDNFILSASSSSGLPVTLSSLSPDVCLISGNAASIISGGICTISADQLGNATYAAATTVIQSFNVDSTIRIQRQFISFMAPDVQIVGGSLNLKATTTSGLVVTFSSRSPSVCTVSGTVTNFLSAGICAISADQPGNDRYYPAMQQTLFSPVIAPLPRQLQIINFTNLGAQTVGGSLNLIATTSSGLVMTFSTLSTSVCTVSGTVVIFLSVGTCTVSANQSGDANYLAAMQVTQSFPVIAILSRQAQIITFINPGLLNVGAGPVSLLAIATSGLPIILDSQTPLICSVSGGMVTAVSPGVCLLIADQMGNGSYLRANRVIQGSIVISNPLLPGAPTNLICTAGAVDATCNLTPPSNNGGAPIKGYSIVCTGMQGSINGSFGSATIPFATPVLQAGVPYVCQAQAVNSVGAGQTSDVSNTFTRLGNATVSPAPSMNRAIAGNTNAVVAFRRPATDGGSAITKYTAISNPSGITGQCAAPCNAIIVSGLNNGTSYSFTVAANNSAGMSAASDASNAVVPLSTNPLGMPTIPLAQRGGAIDIDGTGKGQILLRSANGQHLIGRLVGTQLQFANSAVFNPAYRTIAFGDFNGDGRSDVALQNITQGEFGDVVISYGMDPSNAFTVRSVKLVWLVEAIADMDGDGFTDIVFRYTGNDGNLNDTGVSYIWFMNGNTVTQVRKRGGAPLGWTLLGAADINGDYAADMIYISPNNDIRALMATPARTCANFSAGNLPAGFQALKLADFTGQGRADILHRNPTTGETRLLTLDASALSLPESNANPDDPNASCTPSILQIATTIISLPTVDPSWQFYAAGDFNGDGYVDIVWMQPNGTLSVWLMGPDRMNPTLISNAGLAPIGYSVLQP